MKREREGGERGKSVLAAHDNDNNSNYKIHKIMNILNYKPLKYLAFKWV